VVLSASLLAISLAISSAPSFMVASTTGWIVGVAGSLAHANGCGVEKNSNSFFCPSTHWTVDDCESYERTFPLLARDSLAS
jgi:hypothetical protein